MRFRSMVVLLGVGAAFAGCGGGGDEPDPPTPEEQASAAAMRFLQATDARTVCDELVTERFVEEIYEGDLAACRATDLSSDDPGEPRMGDVRVSGASADASFEIDGGAADGLGGSLELAREGGAWKVDRLGDDYLRTTLKAGIAGTDEGALSVRSMRRCMTRKAETMAPRRLRRFIYQTMREDPKARKTVLAIAEECPRALADYVAAAITDSLKEDGHSRAYLRCVERRLRGYVAVTGLGIEAIKGGDSATAALGGLLIAVDGECAKHDRGAGGARG